MGAQEILTLFCNATTQEWVLVDGFVAQPYYARGLVFGGLIGLADGQPVAELAVPLDTETTNAIAQEAVRRFRRVRWYVAPAPGEN
jgi:hypothetical protein